MAVEHVNKILIAVHNDRRDEFLKALQHQGTVHIVGTEEAQAAALSQNNTSRAVIESIEQLAAKVPRNKKGAAGRPVLSHDEFEQQAASYDYRSRVDRLNRLNLELAELDARRKAIGSEMRRLEPWQMLTDTPQDLYGLKSAVVTFGKLPGEVAYAAAAEALAGKAGALERIADVDGQVMVIVAARPEAAEVVNGILAGERFETADLHGVKGLPADLLARLQDETRRADERATAVRSEIESLAAELPGLKVSADALLNQEARAAAAAVLGKTHTVTLIHGWVRRGDVRRVEKLVTDAGVAAMSRIEPGPDEQPPVALVNRRVFRPFEMVLELFSMPQPTELDPTWVIAPFFATFFAICLTDAGYGIVVALFAFFLMRKMGMGNKLLGIVLIGGILTIPAGALVGGWFGDVPDRLGIGWMQVFKNKLMWFDPVKDPMRFFIISIALGYLQTIVGIVFEIADCIRIRNYGDGLLMQLPWFVVLNALVAKVLLARSLPPWAGTLLMVLILASVAAIVVFTQRSRDTMLSQTLWFALFFAFLLFIGRKLHWLPPGFAVAKWAFWAVYVGMFGHAVVSALRTRKSKPVPIALGLAAATALVLYFVRALPAWVPSLVGVLFFLLSPSNANVLAKFLWGGYALYGATGYIGVILSYIRLMALGMCTGGVAVAINVIAWMLLPIPVVGIIGAIIVLAVGHTYNIAVNVLGAFVHSLRLQYVEFFPRFYAGGGERFVPFRETNQFVSIK